MSANEGRGRVDERALVRVREQMRAGAREIILRRTREDNYRVMVVADVTGDNEPPPGVAAQGRGGGSDGR